MWHCPSSVFCSVNVGTCFSAQNFHESSLHFPPARIVWLAAIGISFNFQLCNRVFPSLLCAPKCRTAAMITAVLVSRVKWPGREYWIAFLTSDYKALDNDRVYLFVSPIELIHYLQWHGFSNVSKGNIVLGNYSVFFYIIFKLFGNLCKFYEIIQRFLCIVFYLCEFDGTQILLACTNFSISCNLRNCFPTNSSAANCAILPGISSSPFYVKKEEISISKMECDAQISLPLLGSLDEHSRIRFRTRIGIRSGMRLKKNVISMPRMVPSLWGWKISDIRISNSALFYLA